MSTAQPQRPTTDDPDDWRACWKAQGRLWRTEPEVHEERRQRIANSAPALDEKDACLQAEAN